MVQNLGHYVFISTGRNRPGIEDIAANIHSFDGYISGLGSHISMNGDIIFSKYFNGEDVIRVLKKLEDKDTPITVITPLYRTNAYEWERFLWCIQTIKNACKPYKIRVIDGFDLMPSDAKYLADGVHPNMMGTVCIANKISEAY
jgi:hydroxymethylpyrimidine pyrophosphatase-like HAD family hydrolase